MKQHFDCSNSVDSDGNPSGGWVDCTGLEIYWQNGPLGRGDDRKEPNGTFVETVIAAAKQRIQHYQTVSDGRFQCEENEAAIRSLDTALAWMSRRTKDREAREVEGTHKV